MHRDKTRWELYKKAVCCLELILEATPHKTASVQLPAPISQTIQENELDIWHTGELMNSVLKWTPIHDCASVSWLVKTSISIVQTQDPASKTSLGMMDDRDRWWERERERESRNSLLSGQLDDDDDISFRLYIYNVVKDKWVSLFKEVFLILVLEIGDFSTWIRIWKWTRL